MGRRGEANHTDLCYPTGEVATLNWLPPRPKKRRLTNTGSSTSDVATSSCEEGAGDATPAAVLQGSGQPCGAVALGTSLDTNACTVALATSAGPHRQREMAAIEENADPTTLLNADGLLASLRFADELAGAQPTLAREGTRAERTREPEELTLVRVVRGRGGVHLERVEGLKGLTHFIVFLRESIVQEGLGNKLAATLIGEEKKEELKKYMSKAASTSDGQAVYAASHYMPKSGATPPDNATDDAETSSSRRVGVLLLNLGGPETLDDVQEFLYNLFADPDILRLPDAVGWAQPLLASVVSYARAPTSQEGYKAIGGGSPIRRTTEEQARALQGAMRAQDVDAKCYVAMRYWNPFTEEAIERVKRDRITDLVILPLYPQFSVSTSGSSLRLLEKIFKEDPALKDLRHTVIPSWYQRRGYVCAMANLIEREILAFDACKQSAKKGLSSRKAHVFFSAHGVPKSYVTEAGDPYKEEMEETVDLIVEELRGRGIEYNGHTLAYQSRVGPVEWLEPYTGDSIRYLANQGVEALVVVPISFVSEHIETLEEIDMEYREVAEDCGIQGWRRVPALGCDEVFISDLASAAIEALPYALPNMGNVAYEADLRDPQTPALLKQSGSLVPMGSVDALLETYDGDRKVLPLPEVSLEWEWGWTRSAELVNGRLAMMALLTIIIFEIATGKAAFLLEAVEDAV
ncbi:ferrochelatase [Chloropicon primus]|nr:ferrochelatase [Chloropicon primus]